MGAEKMVKKEETLLDYLKIRQRFLSKHLGGLVESKTKCGKTWTEKDERDLIILNFRKKEVEGLIEKSKKLDFHISKELDKIKKIDEHRKEVKKDVKN